MKIIRVMCTGRVDASFMLRAFSNKMDGVFIGGCWLGECHYITEGNHSAVATMHVTKKVLKEIGLNPDRIRLESVGASEGTRYAEVVTDFIRQIRELGPLGAEQANGDPSLLKLKLKAAMSIVPYIRLVLTERLRVRFKTREEYDEFFATEEVDRLFKELVGEKLAMQEILLLLKERPLSTGEIADILELTPSEVSKYLGMAARQELTRFDEEQKRFALAR
jgi:F420-non-reducing hydrogenase iron-sulfur subunit